jgi:MATE family, multidrug efflux pump
MTDIAELDLAHAGRRVEGHGLDAWLAEARETLKLALPLAATQLAQMAIMTTDVIMLGHLSTTALAAAALGNTAFFFCWILGCGPVAAVAPMVAHTLGAQPGNVADIRSAVRMGFWAMLAISLPLIALLLFIGPVFLFLGQTPELAYGAQAFTRALCWGLPFSLGYQVLRNFSTALSRPNASLIVMTTAIAFNTCGDYAFIFGHFGMPKLGLVGSGMASACSFTFSFLLMLVVVRLTPSLHRYRIFQDFLRPHWEKLEEVFRLGMPIGLTMMFEAMLFAGSTLLMGRFGTASVAAHMIALNVPSITFMVPLGLGMASTVRVGLAAGAGDKEAVRRAGYGAMLMAVAFMSVTAAILWLFPETIASLYLDPSASSAEVIALAVVFLHVAAVFQIADGVQVVGAMSLRGLKDANAPMWIAGGSYWIAGFPTCLALGFWLHMGGLGVWIGLAFSLLVAAILMTRRFWQLSRR